MLPGPVFNRELVTTARRARYYVIRLMYGLILFFIVWRNYRGWYSTSVYLRLLSPEDRMARFARTTFYSFAALQFATVLLLTPGLVAGSIADERQRKTLHYLLASRLSGPEIVLGKLAARTLHLVVLLAIGLPVLSMLTLLGGIDPREVVVLYLATASMVAFLGGLSIFVSTISRRSRDAHLLAYLLVFVWLLGPPLIAHGMASWWPKVQSWIAPANEWIYATSPIALVARARIAPPGPLSPFGAQPDQRLVAWMIGLQLAYGLAFILLAIWRLRPTFRNQEGRSGRPARTVGAGQGWQRRLFERPACGDAPMLWKERFVGRGSGSSRRASLIIALTIASGLGYETYRFARPAFAELSQNGYHAWWDESRRADFSEFVREVETTLYMVGLLGVACAAAAGVSVEREEDTWTSLTTTTLTGREILVGKMIGALWAFRWLWAGMAALGLVGLAAGSLHPVGMVSALIESAVFLGFAAALGTYISLKSKTSLKAQAVTVGTLLFLNGGYLILVGTLWNRSPLVWLGCTPGIVGSSLVNLHDVGVMLTNFRGKDVYDYGGNWSWKWMIPAGLLSVAVHAAGAAFLTFAAIGGFDDAVGRPRRTSHLGPRPFPPG